MRLTRPLLVPLLVLALAACSDGVDNDDNDATGSPTPSPSAGGQTAALKDADGGDVGTVTLTEEGGGVVVRVEARGLEAGFHGLHVHATGRCDGPGFTTAGGHHAGDGDVHGTHDGDLPPLLVDEGGEARLETRTQRFTLSELDDADGAALIVHAGPDNLANIPTRYGTPDEQTRNTGDSGDRIACAVLVPAEAGTASPTRTGSPVSESPTATVTPTESETGTPTASPTSASASPS